MALQWTLAFDGAVSLATAAVFAYVGSLMHRRHVPDAEGRLAMRLFATWWYALATLTAIGGALAFLAASGALPFSLHRGVLFALMLPLTVALWGLLYYLVYIFTGKSAWLTPLTAAYLVLYFVLVYAVYYLHPVSSDVGPWRVDMHYERELSPPVASALLGLLLGPVLVAAIAYGSLFFTARQRSVRYRVGLVSSAFIFWFGSSALAGMTGVGDLAWWPVASRVISLVSTLMVLAAYRPPRALAEKLGVEPVMHASGEPADPRLRGAVPALLLPRKGQMV